MSRTEAAPAHHVSSGEDEESEESGRTRIGSPDAVVGDSAKTAERTEEKVEKTKKKRENPAAARPGPGPGQGRPAVLDVQKLQRLRLLPNKMPMPGKRSLNLMKQSSKNGSKK